MLWKIALVLLFIWLLGILGVYDVCEIVHLPLFAGLMLLLIAFIRARDAAFREHMKRSRKQQ